MNLLNKSAIEKISLYLSNLLLALPNVLYIARGFFTRFWADDYCFSGLTRSLGFFGGLSYFYQNVSNRFSAFIFIAFTDIFGEAFIRFLPPLAIILLGICLFRLIHRFFPSIQGSGQFLTKTLIVQTQLFLTLLLAPNITQSVYWRSGLTHYFFPLIFLMLIATLILREIQAEKKSGATILIFLLAFFGAGFSESYAALQTGILFFALPAIGPLKKGNKKSAYRLVVVALIASLMAMAVMFLSPGNRLRTELYEGTRDLYTLVTVSIRFAWDFCVYTLRGYWAPLLIALGIGILAGLMLSPRKEPLHSLAWMVYLIASSFGLIICIIAPTVYGMLSYPENRVLILARFILVGAMLGVGILTLSWLNKTLLIKSFPMGLWAFLLVLICLYPLRFLPNLYSDFLEARERAIEWDWRHSQIMALVDEGEQNLEVGSLDSFAEIAELNEDPAFWVNQCAAQFYGVESISALENGFN